ncbi:unnamed protein product [Didymodactylos carnosus]|uniref:Protein kinase domain-containing protein n=1 Tax=Didymodactylos carnosus TaxID=1234261 RepID=A0A815K082_9BILA|nr:unnamed protein product [Didymodactylos carnosus]CAF1386803.1 unnamed protein product [Didymodactylos carnosus]CAF4041439.1 unnamed protein product [Didymodactylos carnosus]CAF4281656.1 unnamed protein product [Didymodactylos carnosus]
MPINLAAKGILTKGQTLGKSAEASKVADEMRNAGPSLAKLIASGSSSDRQYSYEGTAVDVYLLGVLMFMCAPKDVYIPPSNSIIEQVDQLDRKKVSENYCALIVRCLVKDSKLRPIAQEIVDKLDKLAKQSIARGEKRTPGLPWTPMDSYELLWTPGLPWTPEV